MAKRGRRRPVVGGVVVGMLLLPIAINIATGALPEAWSRYAWVGLPVALVLTVVLLVSQRRDDAAGPRAPDGAQHNTTGPGSTQIVSQHGDVNVRLDRPGRDR